jgi:hypothetical protein
MLSIPEISEYNELVRPQKDFGVAWGIVSKLPYDVIIKNLRMPDTVFSSSLKLTIDFLHPYSFTAFLGFVHRFKNHYLVKQGWKKLASMRALLAGNVKQLQEIRLNEDLLSKI